MTDSCAIDTMPFMLDEVFDRFTQWEYAVRLAKRLQYGEVKLTIYDGEIREVFTSHSRRLKPKIK